MSNEQTPDVPPAPTGDASPESTPTADTTLRSDEKTMGMLCHLLGIFTGFLGPLIIWLVKKDSSPFVNDQGKEALNFQITVVICYIVAMLSCFIAIGVVLVPVVIIGALVFAILATLQANKGVRYRYPFAIRLIK